MRAAGGLGRDEAAGGEIEGPLMNISCCCCFAASACLYTRSCSSASVGLAEPDTTDGLGEGAAAARDAPLPPLMLAQSSSSLGCSLARSLGASRSGCQKGVSTSVAAAATWLLLRRERLRSPL